MAIPTSSSLPPSKYFHPLNNSSKFTISKVSRHFLAPPWTNTKFTNVHSSACPPPVLEEDPSSALPLAEFWFATDEYKDGEIDGQYLNKLIRDLLKDSSTLELGVEYYEKAKASTGFRPQKTTIKALLKTLVRVKKWDLISVICRDIKVYNVLPDGLFCASIVSTCIKAKKFNAAEVLLECFECDKRISSVAYCSALRSYNKLHMCSVTLDLYKRMKLSEVVLDPGGIVLIMEANLKLGNYDEVVEMFDRLEGSVGNLENASQVYGVVIQALVKSGEVFRALEQFERMREIGVPMSAYIYASLIGSLAKLKEVNIVEKLVEEAESVQMLKDPALFLKLVIMYVEKGLMERTLDVVNMMKSANLKVSDCIFCAIVNGYAKKRGLKAAAKVYQELVVEGCEPGQVTYASIINVYFRLALFSKAKKVFGEMQLSGFDKCVVAYSTLIVMYGKTGQLREAMKLLAKMKEKGCQPNVWVYNALIDLHGKANNLRQVDKIWKEMNRRKVKPDRVSYTSIIGAYSKARQYDTCAKFYEEYRVNGGTIDLAMGGIMVGVFSKINRIDELVKLLQDLKAEGTKLDARLYRSAWNALRDVGLLNQTRWLQENFGKTLDEPSISGQNRFRKLRQVM